MKKEEQKKGTKVKYVICPRCGINYMSSNEKYCDVCKADLGLIDPSKVLFLDEETNFEKICPICHVNVIGDDEDCCVMCKKEHNKKKVNHELDNWKQSRVNKDSDEISLSDLEEEENSEGIEDEVMEEFDDVDISDDTEDEDYEDEEE